MTADEGRPLIDEQGRLFGAVNIIDALVVLFVAVIIIGGISFVMFSGSDGNQTDNDGGDTGPTTGVRYATLDLGTVSPQVAAQIEVGDTIQTADNANLNITDIYRAQTDETIRVFVRVELEGIIRETASGERFVYGDAPPRVDRELSLQTDRYATAGRIQAIESEGTELDRVEVETVLDVTVSATALDEMAVGDQYSVGGQTVGTIESIQPYGTGKQGARRAQIGVTYVTVAPVSGTQAVLGTTTIREGATLPFAAEGYEIDGEVRRVGSTELNPTEVKTVLSVALPATTLDEMAVGDQYSVSGKTIGTIESIEAYSLEDSDLKQAQIGITYRASTSNTSGRPLLGSTTIREGVTLPFETDRYEISGEVQRIGATEPHGELTTRTVTLELEGVPEERAAQFEAGMAEQIAGQTVAELTEVDVTPETVVVSTADGELVERDSPTNRVVTMTAEVRVRETTAGPRFKNEPLRAGETVYLEFEETSVRPTVINR